MHQPDADDGGGIGNTANSNSQSQQLRNPTLAVAPMTGAIVNTTNSNSPAQSQELRSVTLAVASMTEMTGGIVNSERAQA
jgi:hypothetical protein